MSPEQQASLAELARLRAEIASDRSALVRCLVDVQGVLEGWRREEPGRPHLALAAIALHGWYCALEAALERAARLLDRTVPGGDSWHRELLSQAMTEIPGVRPAILDRDLFPELLRLLEFRHFFRHAYGVDLDPAKLRGNLELAVAVSTPVAEQLDRFEAFLEQAMASVRQ